MEEAVHLTVEEAVHLTRDNMYDYNNILEIYLTMKRIFTHNPYIQLQKSGKQRESFAKFITLLEVMHADPTDYILFAIKYYAAMRVFPSPGHLLSQKLVNKYRYHQSLRNIYIYDMYNVERDKVFIYETAEEIPYKDLMLPVDSDARLKYAIFLSQHSIRKHSKFLKTDYGDVVYAIVKLTHVNRPIPEELKKLKEQLYEENCL